MNTNHTHQSCCQWPAGTLGFDDDISTDNHYSKEEAEGVRKRLCQEGFGGQGKVFPVRTWIKEIAPTPAPATSEGTTPPSYPNEPIGLGIKMTYDQAKRYEAEQALIAATRRAEEAERERDEALEAVERLKEAHQSYIFRIRDMLGMKTPGDGFVNFLEALKDERDSLRETLRQVQAERDEAIELLRNVSNVDTGAEPERVVHRVKLEQREIEPFLSKYES